MKPLDQWPIVSVFIFRGVHFNLIILLHQWIIIWQVLPWLEVRINAWDFGVKGVYEQWVWKIKSTISNMRFNVQLEQLCWPPWWSRPPLRFLPTTLLTPNEGKLNTIEIPMSTSFFFVLMSQALQIDKNGHFFYLYTFLLKPLDILLQVFVRLLPSLISPLDIIQGGVGSTANGLVGLGEWWLVTPENICTPWIISYRAFS